MVFGLSDGVGRCRMVHHPTIANLIDLYCRMVGGWLADGWRMVTIRKLHILSIYIIDLYYRMVGGWLADGPDGI